MRRFFRISESEQILILRLGTLLAIPLAFIVLMPSLFGVWLVAREAGIRSRENRALIERTMEADKASENVLVALVCESIAIRLERTDPSGEEFRDRFGLILANIGRTC